MKLMLIIDDLNYKDMAIRYLKERFPSVEIIEIHNQKQFYSALDDVDAIITDYEIEWTNGIKILIEAKKRNPFMPVIMITETGIEEVVIEEPPPARIMKSVMCDFCGEAVMETRIIEIDGKRACIPCAGKRGKFNG